MHNWAQGCQITAVSGIALIIEWERGMEVFRETYLDPGESHTINLVSPEDGAMIEAPNGALGPFTVSLSNCTPPPPPLTMGETNVLPNSASSGNGDILFAQQTTLGQGGNLQSISIYVPTISSQLRLGIYDDNGGNLGTLLAETAVFTDGPGWNTENTLSSPLLSAGTYWLAFLPEDDTIEIASEAGTGVSRSANYSFAALPNSFPSSPSSGTINFSIYATLIESPSALSLESFGAQQTSSFALILSIIILFCILLTIFTLVFPN